MHFQTSPNLARLAVAAVIVLAPFGAALGQANSYRGLWVGQVILNYATEVTVPLDENNVEIAPDPKTPTPTADRANLRLILHVNGAGHVSLLKDVAVLNRRDGTNFISAESDIALVSDSRLYGEFPPQPAVRFASAVFDFGDSKATEAVNEIIEKVAAAAASSANATGGDTNAARTAALQAGNPIVQSADVAAAFDQFLRGTNFNSARVDAIAGAVNPAIEAQSAFLAATNLQTNSFYLDSRAISMVEAVVRAVEDASAPDKTNAAHAVAASYADTLNDYQRFIAGKLFGDMIAAAAQAAATAATNPTATASSIRAAVNASGVVNDARTEALRIRVALYRDSRSTNAVEQVLNAVVTSAETFLISSNRLQSAIVSAAEAAGRDTLATNVPRFSVSSLIPTPDYDAFVRSSAFQGSAAIAAEAAAQAAVAERRNNSLSTPDSIKNRALVAAVEALRDVLSAAARAVRTELPLTGTFGLGKGDPRLLWEIKQTNGAPLGAAALTGTVMLPANHPTNPFRHRRHPDHAVGFDITRKLRLDFNGAPTNTPARAGYGVDRVTGIFREEIFGLHKPLGPDKDIGLKVEGTFQLNRISHIDTLNAR